jgi:hypothetical protein
MINPNDIIEFDIKDQWEPIDDYRERMIKKNFDNVKEMIIFSESMGLTKKPLHEAIGKDNTVDDFVKGYLKIFFDNITEDTFRDL